MNSSNPNRSAASMRLVALLMESLPAAMAAGRFGRVILQAQMSLHDMNLSHAGRFWQSDAASMGVAEQGKADCCRNTWQVQLGRFGRVMRQIKSKTEAQMHSVL